MKAEANSMSSFRISALESHLSTNGSAVVVEDGGVVVLVEDPVIININC